MTSEEHRVGEAMPNDMIRRDPVPAAVFDRHPRLDPDRLKLDLDLSELIRPETRLAFAASLKSSPGRSRAQSRPPHL